MKNAFVLIPARSGSTRVKNKNMREIEGKPLLAHTIESALQAKVGRVVVSTNSAEIAETARKYGAETPFLRPDDLAQANSSSISCIFHCLEWLRDNEGKDSLPEFLVLRPPTNPFVKPQTITEMVLRISGFPQFNSIVTVAEAMTHPYEICKVDDGNKKLQIGVIEYMGKNVLDFERSQDRPLAYVSSPGCRISRVSWYFDLLKKGITPKRTFDFENSCFYKIPKQEAVDIDDEMDFLIAEKMAETLLRES